MTTNARKRNSNGFTLIEVLIGIVIFALGMMALAQLQGSLARNSSDSSARTVATNIAEELIEQARTFSQITTDPANIKRAYEDIGNVPSSIERGGNTFTVQSSVENYYYNNGTFTKIPRPGAAHSDMKLLEITVGWNSGQEFQIGDGTQTSGRLGSGSITLRDVISSITSPSGGKVALGTAGDNSFAPPVNYNPGENPDIVSIQLGLNKFKESTTPLPDVIRADELVETRFDVVTYSQDDAGATFLRREEFRAVSCECNLQVSTTDTEGGLRPTIWNGNDYTEGEFVSKPFGISASNQQSEFCDLCCRDHHDGGLGENDDTNDPGRSKYNPFRDSTQYYDSTYGSLEGDHKHYRRDRLGNWILAQNNGDLYLEACRMVRKDGFWRIAQDLRQEGLNAFPADYLDDDTEVGVYSKYVTEAVSAYPATDGYERAVSPPVLTPPDEMTPPVVFPASSYGDPMLMSPTTISEQQLRSRGIYLDYISDELRSRIDCLKLPGSSAVGCGVPGVTTALEIIPFYDVQLTWLARWNENPNNSPIDVSNDPIADNNEHSRGVAKQTGIGRSTITNAVHRGNLGLTGTDPVDPGYAGQVEIYPMFAEVSDSSSPPSLSGVRISGEIVSSVPGVKAADVTIRTTDAQCDRTSTGYECQLLAGVSNPRFEVYNYFKKGKVVLGCSDVLEVNGQEHSGSIPSQNWTRFLFPAATMTNGHIIIREDTC